MKRPAIFLDRDGTIIEDGEYVTDPNDVHLLPGAAEAIGSFQRLGFLAVLVSNQSGLARGLFDESALDHVHDRLSDLLAALNVKLDGYYYCPYLDGSEAVIAKYRRASYLRKPLPGMLLQAAKEMGIDLARSWMIGDELRDVEAGRRAGCRTIQLIDARREGTADWVENCHEASDLLEAVKIVEQAMNHDPEMKHAKPLSQPIETLNVPDDKEQVITVLSKIHDLLDQSYRQERQQDFSLLRMFGGLLQMFAIVVAIWGVLAMIDSRQDAAAARLALACFLQLASLSAFAVDRF